MKITLITGGQKSGKTTYAQNRALALSEHPAMIVTAQAQIDDAEFADRILRHQNDRGENWVVYEGPNEWSSFDIQQECCVVDCLTLWLSQRYEQCDFDLDRSLAQSKLYFSDFLKNYQKPLFVVGHELGLGLHGESASVRRFVDLHGLFMQFVATMADEVYMMVSGIPLKVKS